MLRYITSNNLTASLTKSESKQRANLNNRIFYNTCLILILRLINKFLIFRWQGIIGNLIHLYNIIIPSEIAKNKFIYIWVGLSPFNFLKIIIPS